MNRRAQGGCGYGVCPECPPFRLLTQSSAGIFHLLLLSVFFTSWRAALWFVVKSSRVDVGVDRVVAFPHPATLSALTLRPRRNSAVPIAARRGKARRFRLAHHFPRRQKSMTSFVGRGVGRTASPTRRQVPALSTNSAGEREIYE